MKSVVVDTNLCLAPFQDNLDILSEFERLLGEVEPILVESVRTELHTLSQGRGAVGRSAKAAIRFTKDWRRERTDIPGDDGVLDVARRLEAALATNDRKLQQEARRSGLTVLAIRSGKHLWLPFE